MMGTKTVHHHLYLTILTVVICTLNRHVVKARNRGLALGPRDPNVWVGGTLKLQCNITDDNVTKGWQDLYFFKGNTSIPDRFVTKLNSRGAELTLDDIRVQDETTYYCGLNHSLGLYLAKQRIRVYQRPRTVEQIDCVVHNWEWMRCTWDLGLKYHHPNDVEVELVWVIDGSGRSQYSCNPKHFTNTSCEWKENFTADMTYLMGVCIRNKVMNQHDQCKIRTLRKDSSKLVKPAKPANLRVHTYNSTCLELKWNNSKRWRNKTCEIWLQSKWESITNLKPRPWNTTSEREQTVFVCGLHPGAQYNVSVRCRPMVEGFFSERADSLVTMPDDVPEGAPELALGSYKEVLCPDQSCRDVTIYWKPVKESLRNGVITSYDLSVDGLDKPPMDSTANKVTVRLDRDKEYLVTLRASTSAGRSPKVSSLVIQAKPNKPSPPTGVYVKGNSTRPKHVQMFWNTPERNHEAVTGYTIYYCQAWKPQQTCMGQNTKGDKNLQWKSLPANQRNYELELREVAEMYLFGISADTPTTSSGLVWSPCVYLHNRTPSSAPDNFEFSEAKGDLSLTVQWIPYTCEESGPVLLYNLFYCPLSAGATNDECPAEAQTSVGVQPSKSSYTLTGLKDQTSYAVRLQAVTESGRGPATNWIKETAVSTGIKLSSGQVAGVAIGALFVLIFALTGLVVCGRRFKDTVLDPPEESIIIPPPLPDPDRFDSYTDIPDYHTVGPSPAASPTSRTSLLSNGHSTLTSTGSDSTGVTDDSGQRSGNGHVPNGSARSVDRASRSSDKKKKKGKKTLPPLGYIQFGSNDPSKSGSSLGNGNVSTLPPHAVKPSENPVKDAAVLFTMSKGGVPTSESYVLPSIITGHTEFLGAPPSQYQQNVIHHVTAETGGEGKGLASITGQPEQVLSYIKVTDVANNCVGSAVSLASSGGVLRHTPPPDLCSSTDCNLSDYGVYEEPITAPLSASTPLATFPHPRNLHRNTGDSDDSLDQSYVQRPKLTMDSRSLPSILECGNSGRRSSLTDSEDESSTLSLGSSGTSGNQDPHSEVALGEQTCLPVLNPLTGSGYLPHCNGTTVTPNGYLPVPQCPSPTAPLPVVDGYVGRPDMLTNGVVTGGRDLAGLQPSININPKGDGSKLSCSSVVRPISNYMKDLPAEYFLDPQAFDDLPTTEL